jgi:hypothetical protein
MQTAKLCCMVFWALSCLAQNPAEQFEKAPPDVDEALRARIAKFYQAHVDGKFRAADELVAEDSKDAFFAMEKPRCRAFAIGSIKYSDEFARAVAIISCDTEMLMPMMGRMPVKMPIRSQWKLVDGKWFWYVDPVREQVVPTPMGAGKPGPPLPTGGSTSAPPGVIDLETIARSVRADREAVTFNPSAAATEKVVFTNQLPGEVSLSLEPARLDVLELKLDRDKLGQGQSAVLSIRYEPSTKRQPTEAVVRIVVSPTQQVIPVKILFVASSSPPKVK